MDSCAQIVSYDQQLERVSLIRGTIVSKVDNYKWRPLGERGAFRWIDKSELQVDRTYQRSNEYRAKILRLASDWKWESCGAISVMRRDDGRFMVVDGQNRTLAAWHRSDIKELPCMVFESKGLEHEAESFIEINTNRKPVSAITKFRARVVAGHVSALEINQILEENFLILRADGKGAGFINCISACERIYRQSPARLKLVLGLCTQLTNAKSIAVSRILIDGLSYLDRRIAGGLANRKLVERLFQVGAIGLVDAARKMSYRMGKGGEVVYASGMLEVLNRMRGTKFTFESK